MATEGGPGSDRFLRCHAASSIWNTGKWHHLGTLHLKHTCQGLQSPPQLMLACHISLGLFVNMCGASQQVIDIYKP